MYNRYPGGGAPQRVPTPPPPGERPRPSPLPPQRPQPGTPPKRPHQPPPGQRPPPKPPGEKPKAPPPPPGKNPPPRRGLEHILARLDPGKLETEDLLVLAILWLLYRDSGDKDLLIAMGAYLFL